MAVVSLERSIGYIEGSINHLISKRPISVQIGNLGLNLDMPIDLLDSFDE